MSSNLPGSDTLVAVPEYVASDQVHPAHNEDDDTAADDDTPEGETERLLIGVGFVQVAEHVDSEDDHGEGESDEAVGWAEEWPVTGEVGAEEGELGCEQKHCRCRVSTTLVANAGFTYCL
jgi:hypothetical protein